MTSKQAFSKPASRPDRRGKRISPITALQSSRSSHSPLRPRTHGQPAEPASADEQEDGQRRGRRSEQVSRRRGRGPAQEGRGHRDARTGPSIAHRRAETRRRPAGPTGPTPASRFGAVAALGARSSGPARPGQARRGLPSLPGGRPM